MLKVNNASNDNNFLFLSKELKLSAISFLIGVIVFTLLVIGIPFSGKDSYHKNLLNDLKSPDPVIRLSAITQLADAGNQVFPMLLDEMNRVDDPQLKISIVQILGNMKNVDAVDVLIKNLNHDSWKIRFFSVESLGKLNSPQAIQPLKKIIVHDNKKQVRLRALLSLAEIEEFRDIEFLKKVIHQSDQYEDILVAEANKIIAKIEGSEGQVTEE